MALKKWNVLPANKEKAKMLAEECDIDPFIAMLAVSRGYDDAAELEQFLSDEPVLCDPRELIDIQKAAQYINEAVAANRHIAVFGDYDCDGVTATAILYNYLTSRGARVTPYIPDRLDEGYGMNVAAVDSLKSQGVELIITVDNGIACAKEIAYAASLGISTVVTDHHLPPEELPEAVAVVDPHRRDCPSTFKEVCGAQVAFKLICAIEEKEPEQLLDRYADLLCLATVGDVMPLVNENRAMVRQGLLKLKTSPRAGLAMLMSVAGIDRGKINAGSVSFGLVPRINAAGRLGAATRAFELLCETEPMRALELANELDAENARRQQMEKTVIKQAVEKIEKQGLAYSRVIVVAGEGWHQGIVGIVASRIVEKYGKPAVVLSVHDGIAEGSARSISGFSLYDALSACSKHLLKFGGHELAAGMGLEAERIEDFTNALNDYAAAREPAIPSISVDLRLNPAAMSLDMAQSLSMLEPFGMGNPTPVFGLFGVRLDKITPIGEGKHLKLLFSKGDNVFQALLFSVRASQFCFEIGDILDLAVTLGVNEYNSSLNLSVQIKTLRMSGTDDGMLFEQLNAYHDYVCGRKADVSVLIPSRNEVGEIYKTILKRPISSERLKYLGIISVGYGKTKIAVSMLLELGLIRITDGRLTAVPDHARVELETSAVYQKLLEKRRESV